MFWSPRQHQAINFDPPAQVNGEMSFASISLEQCIGRQNRETAHIDIHLMNRQITFDLDEGNFDANPCFGWIDISPDMAMGFMRQLGNFNRRMITCSALPWRQVSDEFMMAEVDLSEYQLPAYQPAYRGRHWWRPKENVVITADFTGTIAYYANMFEKEPLYYN